MKVKEVMGKLSECNPEAEVGYEHCYIDYVIAESDEYVEMGDLRPTGYTRWISYKKLVPDDYPEFKHWLIAFPGDEEGEWTYYLNTNCPFGINVLERSGAMWLSCEGAPGEVERMLNGK